VALDETISTAASEHYVDVETQSELTRGMTVVDRLGVAADERNREVWKPLLGRLRKAKICWSIDTARWKTALYTALAQ
jgi:purine nucleosidase